MLQGRVLCKISLLIIIVITISAYGPWDYLGLYAKQKAADDFIFDSCHVSAYGEIYHKEIKNDKSIYFIRNANVKSDKGILSNTSFLFKSDSDNIPLNSVISIKGEATSFLHARNEGSFDAKKYYLSQSIYFQIDNPEIINYSTPRFFSKEPFYQLNKRIVNIYSRCLSKEDAGIISSIVVGNKQNLDKDIQREFQIAGIAHILAVSGLHVSVICLTLYKLLRRIGNSFTLSSVISGSIGILYGIVSGGSISSIRAIGMFLIFLLAQVLGESYDMITATFALACMMSLANPLLVLNISYILTFGAIIIIWLIVLPINTIFKNYRREYVRIKNNKKGFNQKENRKNKLINGILESLVFSFSITAGMLPITISCFNQFHTLSLIINLVITPFMPIILLVGLIGGLIGIMSIPIGASFLWICHLLIWYIREVTSIFTTEPGMLLYIKKSNVVIVVIYYLVLIILIKLLQNKMINSQSVPPMERVALIRKGFYRLVGIMIVLIIFTIVPKNGSFEINVLDVGQGDGIFINSGDGARFFIDGGSTTEKELGKYTLTPFFKYNGVNSIDYWFVSHLDEDHISGLLEMLNNRFAIKNIVISPKMPRNETLLEIETLAKANNTNVIYMRNGEACGSRHLKFKCVFPNDMIESDDINELCLCLLMEYDKNLDGNPDYTGFFGGDIGAEQERAIAESGLIKNIDMLKVSHHGSRFSSDSDFLSTINPKLAVISCAKKNRYGHPSIEAVERIENVTDSIYYTMDSGQIRINMYGINYTAL